MKNLSIEIIKRLPKTIKKIPYLTGKIHIGDFKELFDAPIKWWKLEDYEKQWKEGLSRLEKYDTSCLVTEVFGLDTTPHIDWWVIYKEKNVLHVQNEVLFGKYYDEAAGNNPFTPESCYSFIQPRTIFTPSGDKPSEWSIPFT